MAVELTKEDIGKIERAFILVGDAYLREFYSRWKIPYVNHVKASEKLKEAKALIDEVLKSKLGEVA